MLHDNQTEISYGGNETNLFSFLDFTFSSLLVGSVDILHPPKTGCYKMTKQKQESEEINSTRCFPVTGRTVRYFSATQDRTKNKAMAKQKQDVKETKSVFFIRLDVLLQLQNKIIYRSIHIYSHPRQGF
jgi:hypothetical protein